MRSQARLRPVLAAALGACLLTSFGCTRPPAAVAPATSAPQGTGPAASNQLPVLATVPAFELVHVDGRRVNAQTLAGQPYIIDFMFTSCTDFCPTMTREMGRVRKALGAHSKVRTVSVSVDPERDGPERLKGYAARHQAVDPLWYFLTGERKVILNMMVGMLLASKKDAAAPNPKLHSTRFVLVDGDGKVRGYYRHEERSAVEQLLRDARALAGEISP